MRDFNKVKTEEEIYGLVFNIQGANAFNSFISLASLIDLPFDGYAFTWAHKTSNKMSKLDIFLVSNGLLALFLYLSALCLDRNLSDHLPILMQELSINYGQPIKPGVMNLSQDKYVKDIRAGVLQYRYVLDRDPGLQMPYKYAYRKPYGERVRDLRKGSGGGRKTPHAGKAFVNLGEGV
ncbi:RNA-directed DNA polymerase, eukaryota, partial [Tanacetum coccineum]